jgi:mono/diheme cytochrome c family protein
MTKTQLLATILLGACAATGCRAGTEANPTVSGGAGGPAGTGAGAAGSGAGGAGPASGTAGTTVADVGSTCTPGANTAGTPVPTRTALSLGATVSQAVAPPAISGGTLLVLADGHTAVAADPDRDQVYVVDLGGRALAATVHLEPGDEPGRSVQDAAGLVHLALRRGGAVVTIDPAGGVITDRQAVCGAPRGVAYDPARDVVHVACAGGELVTLPAAGGAPTRTLALDADLRDVVVDGDVLHVSRFRSAELLTIDAAGTVMWRLSLPPFRSANVRGGQLFTPALAWRMVGMPGGGVAIAHQRGCDDIVQHGGTQQGGYGSGSRSCDTILHSAVSTVSPTGTVTSGAALSDLPLPVDVAFSPDGQQLTVVSAANARQSGTVSVQPFTTSQVSSEVGTGCLLVGTTCPGCAGSQPTGTGEVIAAAYDADAMLWVQTRDPATLAPRTGSPIVLATDSRADTGHAVFHANAGAGLACASCHAEGLDDGRNWNFACVGARRTQSLQVGLRGTEPFHWNGDEADFPTLVHDVFTLRMSGPALAPDQTDATLSWLDGQPRLAPSAAVDPAAAARGQALFTSALCATCHAGAHLTNAQTADVGTGGKFQVPSLVGVSTHPPYLHNGCAATLRDRFDPSCGGGDKHGVTSTLSPAQIDDLVSYLETL